MIRPDVARLGTAGAYVVAACYLLSTVLLSLGLVDPPQGNPPVMDEEMARWFADLPFVYWVYAASTILLLVFFIPVITALSDLLQRTNAGLVRWATVLGYIACAGGLMSRVSQYSYLPLRARIYLEGDELAQAAVKYLWVETLLDPYYWIRYGVFGLWLLFIAVVALQAARRNEKTLPAGWAYLSLVGAVLHLAIPISRSGDIVWLHSLAGGLGGFLVAPLWGIWTGRRLSLLARTGLEREEGARSAKPA